MRLPFFSGLTAANGEPQALTTYSTCTITPDTFANLGNQETFIMQLPNNAAPMTFVLDKLGTYVETGRQKRINLVGDVTANDVRDSLIADLNAAALGFTASISGGNVLCTQNKPGPFVGDNTEQASGAFAITDWSGGALPGIPLRGANITPRGSAYGFDEAAIFLRNTQGTGAMTISYLKIWLYDDETEIWFPPGSAVTGTDKGKLNSGAALNTTGTDQLRHCEKVFGLGAAERIYLEVGVVSGGAGSPTYEAYLKYSQGQQR